MKRKSFFIALIACHIYSIGAMADTKLEAENAQYSSCTLVTSSNYSGGKALELKESQARIIFTYNTENREKCTVYVGYDGLYGEKVVNLAVNGNATTFKVNGQAEAEVGTYIMEEGANIILITPSWTWFRIDYISIVSNSSTIQFDISEQPVDDKAVTCARKIYTFLHDNFGQRTISGMMTGDMSSANGNVTQHADIKAVYEASGKYPALIGFDFLNATGLKQYDSWHQGYTSAAMSLAKDTYQRGGLPAFTWHWRDPSRNTEAFYTSDCNMKISDAMNADGTWNTSSTLYRYIIKDINTIASHFLSLQRDSVACIFRPLHEASGGWFWWGREGAEPFIKLYQLIYNQMVNVKGVHNVIWVWNADGDDVEWNPGSDYYDVVSLDIYNNDFDYSSNYVAFDNVKKLTEGKKIIALSENGPIPDIDKEFDDEAVWSWWMPWYQTWNGNFVDKTSTEEWTKCMNDPRIVTLEDLSDGWDSYTAIHATGSEEDVNETLYDLQGRRLTKVPTRGIYIKGNKKILAH